MYLLIVWGDIFNCLQAIVIESKLILQLVLIFQTSMGFFFLALLIFSFVSSDLALLIF